MPQIPICRTEYYYIVVCDFKSQTAFSVPKGGETMPYIPYTDEQKQFAGSVDLPTFLRMRGDGPMSIK